MTSRYLVQRLRLHQLRALDALEARRSLVKAAATLAVSQPALTRTLHDVEQVLQTRLFDRHARGVRPTAAGLAAVAAARRVLQELRHLDEALDQLHDPAAGTLHLGALPVAAAGVLPGVLARLKEERPSLRIRLHEGRTEDLLPLLAAGELDLVVGRLYAPDAPDGMEREPLWDEPISLLARAGHPIFEATGPLDGWELALPTVTQRISRDIDTLLVQLGLDGAGALRTSSYGLIRELLHATDTVALMPRLMMVGDLLRGTLRVVPLPFQAPDRPAGLILPPGGALSPPGHAFAACLRAYVAEIAGRGFAPAITSGYGWRETSDATKPGARTR